MTATMHHKSVRKTCYSGIIVKIFLFLCCMGFLLNGTSQALKLTVWNPDLTTKVGAGETSGNRFPVFFVKDYNGPIVALFSQTDEEKKINSFSGLQNKYNGTLKNGQLMIYSDDKKENEVSISKFLSYYKLTVSMSSVTSINDHLGYVGMRASQ